jgi:hypothetical protein
MYYFYYGALQYHKCFSMAGSKTFIGRSLHSTSLPHSFFQKVCGNHTSIHHSTQMMQLELTFSFRDKPHGEREAGELTTKPFTVIIFHTGV